MASSRTEAYNACMAKYPKPTKGADETPQDYQQRVKAWRQQLADCMSGAQASNNNALKGQTYA